MGKTFLVCRLVEARGCEAHGFASERAALFSGEILLAELDPVDAGLHSRSDFLEENFVSLWGFRRHKAAAIRHVAEQRGRGRFRQGGHGLGPSASWCRPRYAR